MYTALKDVNNGVVYQWTNNLTNESVIIESTNWKKESEWSKDEIANLFSTPVDKDNEEDFPVNKDNEEDFNVLFDDITDEEYSSLEEDDN